MKIGIDIDEVLADFVNPLVEFHNGEYGTNLKRNDFKSFNLRETWGGTYEDDLRKVYEFFNSNFCGKIVPLKGSQEAINFLSKSNEMITISSRPNYIVDETKKWINNYYLRCFRDTRFTYQVKSNVGVKKRAICLEEDIGVLIEDVLNNVISCSEVVDKVILFDAPWNQSNGLPKNVTRIKNQNWSEVLEVLK